MKFLFIVVVFIFLGGCSINNPAVKEYRIHLEPKTVTYDSQSCKEKSLKVGQVFSSSSLLSHRMKYMKDGYSEFSFTQSEWAQSPNKALSAELVKSVRSSGLFSSVNSYKSRSRSDLILETNLEEFIQYFSNDNNSSFVNISLSLSLVETGTSKVLQTKYISKKLGTKSLDAQGGVKAFNEALSGVLKESNDWLSEACK
ncbi:ABC-type transport auxiliary lipoprotein family protein [Sulfurimonas aquatica]|nr:ABC-type transport auxiliary lipoprotein family protein [Sulfurimonas aquatica]